MTPFVPAVIPESEIQRAARDFAGYGASELLLRQLLEDQRIFQNDTYQVMRREMGAPGEPPYLVHLSIKRRDRQPVHDWRDLQQIKNELVGPECEAVELYPAESRRVDVANQFHLWCMLDPSFRFPFGFSERLVSDENIGKARQRPGAGGKNA